MRFNSVRRYADYLRARCDIICPAVTHRAQLLCADGCLIARIKEHHYDMPASIRQTPVFAPLILQSEVRSLFINMNSNGPTHICFSWRRGVWQVALKSTPALFSVS